MRQTIELQVGVYPYRVVDGQVVSWNSVVRRRLPGERRWDVTVLAPVVSPELAHQNAQNWVQVHCR